MKVWNTTTNEDTELRYSNLSDPYIDDAQDIIGNAGGLHYNREAGRYEMDADEIAWWDEYLTNAHDDAEQAAVVNGHEIIRPMGTAHDYRVIVRENSSSTAYRLFRTFKAASAFCLTF